MKTRPLLVLSLFALSLSGPAQADWWQDTKASLRYREVELIGTFVPGFTQGGNTGYLFGRFSF